MHLNRVHRVTGILVLLIIMLITALQPCSAAQAASGFLPKKNHKGVLYQARPPAETTTVLLLGYDHQAHGQQTELHGYNSGGQSDFMLLMVFDHVQEKIRMLQIDRDTMTMIKPVAYTGQQLSPRLFQICLAHAYGRSREENNANAVWAVENMLGIAGDYDGAQVDFYVAMDISGISRLNDLLGGVTVTITEDMTAFDPAMEAGKTMTLTGSQAEIFCRGRYGVGDQTNASRMQRQRVYMDAAGDKLIERVHANAGFATELLNGMGLIHDRTVDRSNPFAAAVDETPTGDANGRYLMSNESVSGIVNLLARVIDYESDPIETLAGTHRLGQDGYIWLELEEDVAVEWALSAMYVLDE